MPFQQFSSSFFPAGESWNKESYSDSASLFAVSCHAGGHPSESRLRRSLWFLCTLCRGPGIDGGTHWGC